VPTRAVRVESDDWKVRQRTWADVITAARNDAGLTSEALAVSLGVSVDTLRNWVTARTRFDTTRLTAIAEAVGVSVVVQAQLLGMLPGDVTHIVLDLEEAQERIRHLQGVILNEGAFAAAPRPHEATARVVECTLLSDLWSARVTPWFDGPKPFRIRVADRIQLDSLRADTTVTAGLAEDEILNSMLARSGAARCKWHEDDDFPSQAPSETQSNLADPEVGPTVDMRSVWIVPTLNANRVPSREPLETVPRSIVVVSTHFSSWATDVSALLALCLGFGSGNTNLYTRVFYGPDIVSPSRNEERRRLREEQAAELIADPFKRAKYLVWGHSEPGALQPVLNHLREGSRPPMVIFLRPTDRLQEYMTQRPTRAATWDSLVAQRAVMDAAIAMASVPAMSINVGFPTGFPINQPVTQDLRDALFARAMLNTTDALRQLFAPGIEIVTSEAIADMLHHNTPDTFTAFVRACEIDRKSVSPPLGIMEFE